MGRDIAAHDEQVYGEGWDAAPDIKGIPGAYQELLNKFYVIARDEWPAERLMNLDAVAMSGYYGDVPLAD